MYEIHGAFSCVWSIPLFVAFVKDYVSMSSIPYLESHVKNLYKT